jgi:hypothetical protein
VEFRFDSTIDCSAPPLGALGFAKKAFSRI